MPSWVNLQNLLSQQPPGLLSQSPGAAPQQPGQSPMPQTPSSGGDLMSSLIGGLGQGQGLTPQMAMMANQVLQPTGTPPAPGSLGPWTGGGNPIVGAGQYDPLTPQQRAFMGWGGVGQPDTWEKGMFGPSGYAGGGPPS